MDETTQLPLEIKPLEQVYQDRNQKIQRVIAYFNGFIKEYFVSDHGKRAALLVVLNGKILLVKQYRLLINDLSYEIPGGRVDEKETPEAAAVRECFEETGVKCSDLKPLISYHPSLDIWKNYTEIFLSEDSTSFVQSGTETCVWIPLKECIEMIFSQRITDSLSIIAILAYYANNVAPV